MPPKKILLAEDDQDDRYLFEDYLSIREDILLLPIAQNGVEVRDFMEKNSSSNKLPDIIILDQNMPMQNGIQTLVSLKEDKRYLHIPIIIYSTYADHQLVKNCTSRGAAMVISKPLSKAGYQEMMNEILKVINA